jgi:Transposase DNA-binding
LDAALVNFGRIAFTFAIWAGVTKAAQQWTEQEFAGMDLGDARLNRRAKKVVDDLRPNRRPSIPEACDSWSETCAAYRFLRNPDVAWERILAPHWASTQERMRKQSVVLCIQDTTELDFNGQEIAGPGRQ